MSLESDILFETAPRARRVPGSLALCSSALKNRGPQSAGRRIARVGQRDH